MTLRSNLLTLIFCIFVILSVFFMLYYYPLLVNSKSIEIQTEYFNGITKMSNIGKNINDKIDNKLNRPVTTSLEDNIEDFIRTINIVGEKAGVLIHKMEPAKTTGDKASFKFYLELITDYEPFVKFISGLEQKIDIQNLAIHPYLNDQHIVSCTISPLKKGEYISSQKKAFLENSFMVNQNGKEKYPNPFTFKSGAPSIKEVTTDLTWVYHLTSTRISDREATIDRTFVRVGDDFPHGSGQEIIRIQSDRVHLRKGNAKFVIKFRERKRK